MEKLNKLYLAAVLLLACAAMGKYDLYRHILISLCVWVQRKLGLHSLPLRKRNLISAIIGRDPLNRLNRIHRIHMQPIYFRASK